MRQCKRDRRSRAAASRPVPLRVETLEDRLAPASLNSIINGILADNYIVNPPSGERTFDVPEATVGVTLGGGVDIRITDTKLTFSGVGGGPGSWTGEVTLTSKSGVLLDGLLDLALEDGDDADSFAVTGRINLAAGTAAALNFDSVDAEQIGVPSFLDVQFTDLALNFENFRGDENKNTLGVEFQLAGIDTGIDELNDLMASDNPLFQITLHGTVSATLDLTEIEAEAAASPPGQAVAAFQKGLAIAMAEGLEDPSFTVAGKAFHLGDFAGTAVYHTVAVDPDGTGPLPEETSGYLAVEGGFRVGNQELGGRGRKFDVAFAISDLGPLQFYLSMSPESENSGEPETKGIKVESAGFGVIFNTTIEQLQSGIDYSATAATALAASGSKFLVTLTIPGHDLEAGDSFAIVEASGAPNYVGEYEVESVLGDKVTVEMDRDPGTFVGTASVIRRTIKDPLDLRDDGLRAGVIPPGDIFQWRSQLDAAVRNQLAAGDDVWSQVFGDIVFGGTATLSYSEIPDTVLLFDVQMLLDTDMRAMMSGNMLLVDGVVQLPVSLYGDLSNLLDGEGRLLFLADVAQVDLLLDDPLVTLRGEAAFKVIENGFQISLEGGVDLNIPEATTLTLEGEATLAFSSPSGGPAVQIDLGIDAALSETNIGDIAALRGNFHLSIDSPVGNDDTHGPVAFWGAALLTTRPDFLEEVGLFTNASALLRVNSSGSAKPAEVLQNDFGQEVHVALPAGSFALRLDGSADFRIDFNADRTFSPGESVAGLGGIFVLEFSAEGLNVALFNERNGAVVPASIAIGPSGGRFLEFGVLGFLAIRSDGIAASLVLTVDASLPLGLTEVEGRAVFIVNTTGHAVTFDIPGGVDPNRAAGLTVTIPKAAPSNPGAVLAGGLNALVSGSPSWTEGSAGPYGVVFIVGDLNLLDVLEIDVSGYILLKKDVVSLSATFSAEADFLNLAKGSVSGSIFFSSQGEFEVLANGRVQLGPDGFNINGSAGLTISYLDSDGKGAAGNGTKKLAVTGNLNVGATVFYVDMGQLTLGVSYKEPDITVSLTVPVPDIAWTEPDPLFGVSWPYPTIVNKPYSFTVGTLTVNPVKPPPIYLATLTGGGVLRLNVGANANARNYNPTELNEVVSIARVGAGSVSGEKIQVTMFGISQEYDNVTSVSANMGDGDDFLDITGGITVPVVAYLGTGADTLRNATAAFVTAHGEGGRDRLTGGSETDWLFGGAGSDVIDGGAGADVIEGGADNDFLIGGDGSDTIRGGEGQDVIAGDLGRTTGTAAGIDFSSQASASGGADTIYGGRGADIIFGGSGGDTLYGEGENDTLLGGDGRATIGSTTVVVSLALGSDGADSFHWAVGEGNDTIDGQLGSDTLNVLGTDADEAFTLTASGTGFSTTVGAATLSVSGVETASLDGRGGAETFTINDLTGSALTQINLDLGSDVLQDRVDVHGSSSADVYSISTVGAALRVQKSGGATIDVVQLSSASGDAVALHTGGGSDVVNVRGVAGPTVVDVGAGLDTINVGSNAQGTTANPNDNRDGHLNAVTASLTITGDGGDVLNVDNSGDAASRLWTQTATTLTAALAPPAVITYGGLAALNISLGGGADTYRVTDLANAATTSVDGGDAADTFDLDIAGDEPGSLKVTRFENVSLDVGSDVSGSWEVAGPGDVAHINIGGSLTDAGSVKVVSVPAVNIGRDLAGVLTVTGLLGDVRVGGAAPGLIDAGDVGTIGVANGTGPVALRVVEAGVLRRVEAALPNNPYPNPKDVGTPAELRFPADVAVRLFYDSLGLTSPSLAVRVTNPSARPFDLSLAAHSETAKFNLARLDGEGRTYIRNVVVEGDLLAGVSAAMVGYLGYAAGTPGGVQLPLDTLNGVAVTDIMPARSINVAGIQGVGFGSIVLGPGVTRSANQAYYYDAVQAFTDGSADVRAVNGTLRAAFRSGAPTAYWFNSDPSQGQLDSRPLRFGDQNALAQHAAPDARGSVTALVEVARVGTANRVQTIAFRGDGASLRTDLPIDRLVSSTGGLGDLAFGSPEGLRADVTAPSFFGNIEVPVGQLRGTVQSTGRRTDPVTGAVSPVEADIGRVLYDAKGAPTGVTTIKATTGLTGRIVSRGDLISQLRIDGGSTGVIAAAGDIGVLVPSGQGPARRFGGITFNGINRGRIVALGNVYGDLLFNGVFMGGAVAVRGSIRGNLTLNGALDADSKVVVGGAIGDAGLNTAMWLGSARGIVAAGGAIRQGLIFNTSGARFAAANVTGANAAALNAIFSDGGTLLSLDVGDGDLAGLSLILTDLDRLTATGGILGGTRV